MHGALEEADRVELFTIGYGGRNVQTFITALKRARVDRVIDVRELPLSRKRGFSKRALHEALAKAGIEYVHLRVAGNPFRKEAADIERCLALYAGHLDDHPGVIDEVRTAARGHRAALLCAESDAASCHRSVLAERVVGARKGARTTHL